MAANYFAIFIENHRPEEPVVGEDDQEVKFIDLGCPFIIKLAKVDILKGAIR
jgi:hypothetical protein